MSGNPRPDPDAEDEPIVPHAAPLRDAQGRLTYIGEDGRRYIVAPPPSPEPPSPEPPTPEPPQPGR